MKLELNRTLAAFVLAVAAVALPCASWYVVGSREVAKEIARIEEEPQRAVHDVATRLAERLAARLEALRASETERPFYHYQNLYHEPKGASEGVSVIPSPLAQGPTDPLIRSYFQIDDAGKITLPTLNEEVSELNRSDDLSTQRLIQDELRTAAPQMADKFEQELTKQSTALPSAAQSPVQRQESQVGQKVEVLERKAYAQNVQASKLYTDIKSGKGKEASSSTELYARRSVANGQGDVLVKVGPFAWHTITIEDLPSLVALREVITPDGRLTQGFVVIPQAMKKWLTSLGAAGFQLQITPGTAVTIGEARVPLPGVDWKISCDPTQALTAARAKALRLQRQFWQSFIVGMCAATFAALSVVFIVWQTDRLARQRSQFAASAAHELRTPLAGLRMYAEMLAEGLGDPARAKDYARRLATEAERLGRVVANVLGFTRLERGILKAHPEPGDLAAAVRDCVARQQPTLDAAGARLALNIADSLPTVRFDRDAIAQILQNLLDNAEKHTREATDRTIHVTLAAGNSAVTLTVRDHGPGIPAETQRRLFQPFERGNVADGPAGLGLGLVIVQALVRAHAGTVAYADAPGGGASFIVTLPV